MKKYVVALMVALSAATMVVPEADAKRMGGGSSIGRQSQSMNRQATPPAQQQPSQASQAAPANPGAAAANAARPSPWRGILGGALLGLGLGALLSHLGIGGALASVIGTILTFALIALAIMFIVRMVRGKNGGNRPAYAGAGFGGQPMARTPEIGSGLNQPSGPAAFQDQTAYSSAGAATMDVPADFDVPAFLRHAKTYFIRLQAAWDRADINDIREFTTPEMFGELRLQLQERGASANHTDVVSLDAELVGMERTATDYVASVRFSGMIREEENAPAQPFAEAWHLSKPIAGQGGWVLAGIQQLS
ncbi:Tim44 domain-containing protein [Noviherbaspirillum aridicola]|uniref:Membrane protein n=1 Tax=Noviherbaspirillum aridicola TaxID=2849687 RepID=A0ABQ4Q1F0_9BURK|nr:Tim44-like domain-containing protein [Noviherbaspirillum aridicola]GIZ50882.1 membrane protein [Noviherbaspirillum aridicola]